MIGYASGSYAAQVAPNIALATRFGVNLYSYESDLSIGGEWWLGSKRGKTASEESATTAEHANEQMNRQAENQITLKNEGVDDTRIGRPLESTIPVVQVFEPKTDDLLLPPLVEDNKEGVIKARLSGNWVSHLHSRLRRSKYR